MQNQMQNNTDQLILQALLAIAQALGNGTNTIKQTTHISSAYKWIPAGQGGVILGTTGATGDVIDRLIIVPTATTGIGSVQITDSGVTTLTAYQGGALTNLQPFKLDIGLPCTGTGWTLSTGSNVSVIACGSFT